VEFTCGSNHVTLEKSLGPRIPDGIQWAEGKTYDLLIGTGRRKPRWGRLITVRYENHLYEVLKETAGEGPYRYRYELRRNPKWHVTRKICDYHPDEVLKSTWKLEDEIMRKT
jgi:hypothetical protein